MEAGEIWCWSCFEIADVMYNVWKIFDVLIQFVGALLFLLFELALDLSRSISIILMSSSIPLSIYCISKGKIPDESYRHSFPGVIYNTGKFDSLARKVMN